MIRIRTTTMVFALLLAAGEIARWARSPHFVPLAFDELIVALALAAAAWVAPRRGTAPLAAAWGLFTGMSLVLLVETLDHFFAGPPKDSAVSYAAILSLMVAFGAGATLRSLALARGSG